MADSRTGVGSDVADRRGFYSPTWRTAPRGGRAWVLLGRRVTTAPRTSDGLTSAAYTVAVAEEKPTAMPRRTRPTRSVANDALSATASAPAM